MLADSEELGWYYLHTIPLTDVTVIITAFFDEVVGITIVYLN